MPAVSAVAHDSLPALEAEIDRVGPENVAAFFCEPVIGAGGVYLPPDGYVEGVADLCAEHGILLVIDSVICGFGRLGTWYGIERWEDVRPDMITFAKGVTAGYLPLGGVVVSDAVAGPFFEAPGGPMLRHGATYAGHPACCAAAMAVLDVYERDGLFERSRALEGPLAEALAPLADHPAVAEVRAGLGLLAAVQLAPEALEPDAGAVAKVAQGAREAGVLVRPLLGAVAMSPPLTVEQEHIDLLAQAIRTGLRLARVAQAAPAYVTAAGQEAVDRPFAPSGDGLHATAGSNVSASPGWRAAADRAAPHDPTRPQFRALAAADQSRLAPSSRTWWPAAAAISATSSGVAAAPAPAAAPGRRRRGSP